MVMRAPEDPRPVTTEREYYADEVLGEARSRSGEVDFGVMWTPAGSPWPHWRVSWVRDSGELYAVELVNSPPDRRALEVLGKFRDRDHVETALEGWAEQCGSFLGCLEWIRHRARMGGLR